MSIKSVINDTVTSESIVNALKPLPPTITGYTISGLDDTALDPAGGQTVQINGTGFLPGATITFDGSAVSVVTYVNANQLSFTTPAKSAGTYTIYVVNSDGGTAIYIPGIIYSVLPTWTTTAGTLGSYYETTNISNTVVASGDAPITYSLFSGSLPTGASLAANGVITGTAPVDSSSTTYSFTIKATDAQLQDSTRSFSLTINTDAVTWVSPANATTYTSAVNSAIANVTLSATDAAGYNVTYSANALPTGLSLSGANISGTPTVIADSSTLLTATAATTNRTATRTINWSITVANDAYFEYNTLLIPGASTTFVDDASTNNFAVTINGDTKPNSFNPYTPGYYSVQFNGTSDYLTIPHNDNLVLALYGGFSVECWVYMTSLTAGQYIWNKNGVNGSKYPSVGLQWNGTTFRLVYGNSTGLSTVEYINFNTIPNILNNWVHIATQINGSTIQSWVNGAYQPDTYILQNPPVDNGQPFYIGGQSGATSNATGLFSGYISNLRVIIGGVYYDGSTAARSLPPVPASPVQAVSINSYYFASGETQLVACNSARFMDLSSNNHTVNGVGAPKVSGFVPYTPNNSYSTYGSGYFDGTGDYLSLSNTISFESANFTVEMWIYPTSLASSMKLYGAWGGYQFWIGTNGRVIWQFGGSNSPDIAALYISANRWVHIAWVRFGNSMLTFIDGVLKDTTSYSGTVNSSVLPVIGKASDSASDYFYGYMSNLRIVNGTAVYTTAFTPPTSPLTAIANTSLLTLQNNQSVNNSTFLDNSTNNFLVTRAGNATQGTFSPYGGNWSNYFGSANYISAPSNAAFGFGTGDFTVEAWVFPNAAYTTYNYIYTTGVTNGLVFYVLGGVLYVRQYGASDLLASSTAPALNTWTHVAATRSGTTLRIFVNGVQTGTTTNSTNFATGSGFVGNDGTNVAPWLGYISNLRVVKGTAVYTSNFTPSTTPLTAISGTSLLTCQSNRLIDNSINNFAITKNGDVSVQRFSPFNPSSVTPTSYSGYFDGSGDYLSVAYNSAFNVAGGTFTIEAWINITGSFATDSGGNKQGAIAVFGPATAGQGWEFFIDQTSNILYFSVMGSNSNYMRCSYTFSLNTWYHVAVVRNGSSNYLFVNGASQTLTIDAYTGGPAASGTLNIGAAAKFSGYEHYFIGYISNFRIVNGTALYTSNFTPSTTPLTTTSQGATASQVSLLTLQSTTFIDNSTNNFTITAAGNSQPTQQNPFGFTSTTTNGYTPSTIGGSGYFDGTGDYLQLLNATPVAIGTGAFTAEAWIYLLVLDTWQGGISTIGTFGTGFSFNVSNTNKVRFSIGNSGAGTDLDSTASVIKNTWTHIAIVRNSNSTMSLFINGVLQGTATSSANITNTECVIGRGYLNLDVNYLNGYISDARVIKGQALYNSNFVPPVQPLTAVQNTVLLTNMTNASMHDFAMTTTLESKGDTKVSTAISKFGGSSMYFDGSGDYLFVPSTQFQNFALGTGDYTIECWIYQVSFSGDMVIAASFSTWASSVNFYLGTRSGSPNILIFRAGDGVPITLNGNTGLTTSTWTHIAVCRASGVTRMFVGGVAQTATHTGSVNISATTQAMGIGAANNGTEPMNGYIDDFRITKGYARYTANFTPPATGFLTY